jgi:hypothetical protein
MLHPVYHMKNYNDIGFGQSLLISRRSTKGPCQDRQFASAGRGRVHTLLRPARSSSHRRASGKTGAGIIGSGDREIAGKAFLV